MTSVNECFTWFVNRRALWFLTRAARWKYRPKRCKTRRDKLEDKSNRRLFAYGEVDWREIIRNVPIEVGVLNNSSERDSK